MPLYQKSVLKKYLKQQDSEAVAKAFKKFIKYFHDPKIQRNIRSSKEEEYQGIFLTELFSKILGYTMKPNDHYNLVAEYKNEKNSKKADGAILKDDQAIAVIELKGTNTKDLEKVRQQAFDYKANQTGCVYVITSNFEKIRFYINNAVDFEEFDLFHLNKDGFDLLYLCLAKDNVLSNLPLKIKEASVQEEEAITKKFYADYSLFKRELFRDLVRLNMKNEVFRAELSSEDSDRASKNIKRTLFKKSQKLIDRFLFIFFAEDRGLLPPNSTVKILEQWNKLKELDEVVPLHNRFKKYFNYLDQGRKGTNKTAEIFAYNGGLFKFDAILDSLFISDELLHKHSMALSNYDFESQVDVNILGHIFENSLNEIESVNAEIEGAEFDKQKTKRKKDGVFYTPKYITKYIVDNTIGKLCSDKKAELKIVDEEFHAKRQKETKKKLLAALDAYREWLLQLSILDPACGSGAFLNQALDFLIKEHQHLDELQTNLLGGGLVFPNIETTVLENNIYGVDLNEESVEIAKLSLWLRTAQPRRKLNNLNSNIKCGNSLIDSKAVAGDKAFNWQNEFPNIFPKKEKKAWHITTATHNSRYSQRMFDNHVILGDAEHFDEKDEIIITETVKNIAIEDKLNILEYNICGDHMHILLVCEENELARIVGKLKSVSAKLRNRSRGYTVASEVESVASSTAIPATATRGHAPLSDSTETDLVESDAYSADIPVSNTLSSELSSNNETTRGKTQRQVWTQKFGKSEIKDEEYLANAKEYIRTNREKHDLPKVKEIEKLKKEFLCTHNHAFRTEYKGGFDVVIGNPPYVHLEAIKDESEKLSRLGYSTFDKRGDLYPLFVERGINILKQGGIISYIMPNKWLQAGYGKNLREYFLSKQLVQLIDFGDIQIFQGATTYPCIYIAKNAQAQKAFSVSVLKSSNSFDFEQNVYSTNEEFKTAEFSSDTWVISSKKEKEFLKKLSIKHQTLNESLSKGTFRGILTGLSEAFLIDENTKNDIIQADEKASAFIYPFLQGRDVQPYVSPEAYNYLLLFEKGYTKSQLGNCSEEEGWSWLESTYPSIAKWLLQFEEKGKKRTDKGDFWWEVRACDYYTEFHKPKIMYQAFQVKSCFVYDINGLYCNNSMWIIPTDNKALVAVLNSKMGWWLTTKYCTQIQNGCQLIWKYFGQIPIPELSNPKLLSSTEQMLDLQSRQQSVTTKFTKYLQSQFTIEKLPKKLQNWHDLEFGDFIKELNKAIKKAGGEKLSKMDEMDWMEVFETKKAEAQSLKAEIDKTDKEIDQMVYQLYGLTEKEIQIVENS